jgi:hypothetical protein
MVKECFPPEYLTDVEGGRAENAWLSASYSGKGNLAPAEGRPH